MTTPQPRRATAPKTNLLATLYRWTTTLALPGIEIFLERRRMRGREDSTRLGERRGYASRPRPAGPLVWMHAASIGEALSVLRLIEQLLERYEALNILITTGTVTSARLLAERLPERAIHQYVPVDRMAWVKRFLDHWRPDAAMWVESELWPNLVQETQARGIPMTLLNARMSAGSFARWRRAPRLSRCLLGGFSLVMAQAEAEAERLRALGADPVLVPGNLKFAAGPLPVDSHALEAFKHMTEGCAVWVASSTHEGEEEIAAYAHKRVAPQIKGLLTVIVPRHPSRGTSITQKLRDLGLTVARRGNDEPVTATTDIYVADTLGELGLFYRAALVAFIGGSLIPHGGQNILEPARLGAPVLHGPHMENFHAIVEEMTGKGAAFEVADAEELVKLLTQLLGDAAGRQGVAASAQRIATAKDGILDTVASQLEPLLASIAGPARRTVETAAAGRGTDESP